MRTRQVRKDRRSRMIAEQNIASVFGDGPIRKLGIDCKQLAAADLGILGALVREAAWFFAQEVGIPNANELNEEISDLYRLAKRTLCAVKPKGPNRLPAKTGIAEMFESLAKARENLSAEAVERLNSHGNSELPLPNALRDAEQWEAACEAIAACCCLGGSWSQDDSGPVARAHAPVCARCCMHLRGALISQSETQN